MTLRTTLELCKEHKPNGLILKFSRAGLLLLCKNSVPAVRYKGRLNVLSGSACFRYRAFIQGMLGTAIIIPSYALAAFNSP
jgi:hypothetical protein